MKQQPISTEQQKIDFLKVYEREVRGADSEKLKELVAKIVLRMVESGLYRKTTAKVDIIHSVKKRFREMGWTT